MQEVNFRSDSKVELVSTNGSDEMVALSAWVSNGLNDDERLADGTRVQGLINFLWRERHTSPFEAGQFIFRIETPIFVAREFIRHRTYSINEYSGRYTFMKPDFYIPTADRGMIQQGKIGNYSFMPDEQIAAVVIASLKDSAEYEWKKYANLVEIGAANEVARMGLPLHIYTEFYASINPRNLMHFLMLRNDPPALHEIRELAAQMEAIFAEQMPMTYNAFVKYDWRKHEQGNN